MNRAAILALLGLGLVVRTAEAGIVVFENGSVLEGTIDPRETTGESVVIHQPRSKPGGERSRGKIVAPRDQIRWMDSKGDAITPEYFKQFGDKFLDNKWRRVYDRIPDGPDLIGPPDIRRILTGSLAARYTKSWDESDLSLLPLKGTLKDAGDLACFQLEGSSRVHVYSAPNTGKAPSVQLDAVQSWLKEIASADGYSVDATPTVVAVPGGHDVRFTTTLHSSEGHTRRALREVLFRARRTYFVTCYASERDFPARRADFEALLDSIRVDEGDAVDLALVEAGQTWRWRSTTRADAVAWHIAGKEPHALRYHERIDGEPLGGERTAPARIEARSALLAATGVPASPTLAGSEALDVSGARLACDIYEAHAEGKTFRVWISKSFPAAIKVTVDGVVLRELAQFK